MDCHTFCTLIIHHQQVIISLPNTMEHGITAHNAGIQEAVIIFLKINIVEVAKMDNCQIMKEV